MKTQDIGHRSLVEPLTLLALLLCLFSWIELWRLGEESPTIDFYRAWAMAQSPTRYATGDSQNPYSEAAQQLLAEAMRKRVELAGHPPRLAAAVEASDHLRLTATPFLYSVFGLVSNQTYERDARLYRLLCLTSTVLAVGLLGKIWGYSLLGVLLWLTLLAQLFQPLRSDLRVGNVNQLQLAQLAVFLGLSAWAEHRRRDGGRAADLLTAAAGLTLTLAVAFKPNVAPIVPLILLLRCRRDRLRELSFLSAGLISGGVLAQTIGSSFFGSWRIWQHWLAALRETPDQAMPARYGNFAPSRLLADRFGLEAGPLLTVIFALLVVGALVLRHRQLGVSKFGDAYAAGLGLLGALITSPLVWQHYFLLTVPLFMLILSPDGSRGGPRVLAVPALVLLSVNPFADLLAITDPVRQAPLVHLGLALLLGASLWAVWAESDRSKSSHQLTSSLSHFLVFLRQ